MNHKHQRALERILHAIAAEREAAGEPQGAAYTGAYDEIADHAHRVTAGEIYDAERNIAAGSLFHVHPEPGAATDAFADAIRDQEDTNGEDVGAMANARANADAAFRRMVEQDW